MASLRLIPFPRLQAAVLRRCRAERHQSTDASNLLFTSSSSSSSSPPLPASSSSSTAAPDQSLENVPAPPLHSISLDFGATSMPSQLQSSTKRYLDDALQGLTFPHFFTTRRFPPLLLKAFLRMSSLIIPFGFDFSTHIY